ncbi:MAG TPA: hypothetical protein VF317_12865 [Dermatophilaceae bacterium]
MIRRLRRSVIGRLVPLLAILAFFMMTGGQGVANADCWSSPGSPPGVPAPQAPNSGFSGSIDPGFGSQVGQPDLAEPNFGPYVNQFFVRPPAWSAYDHGCQPDPAGTAGIQSTLGNFFMGGASVLTSITSAIHRQVSPPDLHFLDGIVRTGTQAVKDALFSPWIGVSFLILAGWLVLRAMKGELHGVFTTGAAAVVLVGLAAVLVNQSVQMASYFDQMASDTVGGIYKTMSPDTGGNPFDPASPRAGAVTDVVLYQNWLRGMVGDPNSEVAKKYGTRLLNDTTYSQSEWAAIQAGHAKETDIDKTKGDDFTKIAKEIQTDYPNAYRVLQGKTGDRFGAGAFAFVSALCVTPFLAFADLLLFMGLLMVRVAVVVFPAIAIVAIFPRFRHLATGLVGTVGTGLFNAIIFAAASAFDMLFIQQLVGPDSKVPRWFGLVLCALLSVGLYKLLKPHQQFKNMTSIVSDPLDRATAGPRAKLAKVKGKAQEAAEGAGAGAPAGPEGAAVGAGVAMAGPTHTTPQARPEGWTRPPAAQNAPPLARVIQAGSAPTSAPRALPPAATPAAGIAVSSNGHSTPTARVPLDVYDAPVKPADDVPVFTPWQRPAIDAPTVAPAPVPHDGDLTVADGVVAHRVYNPQTKTFEVS